MLDLLQQRNTHDPHDFDGRTYEMGWEYVGSFADQRGEASATAAEAN